MKKLAALNHPSYLHHIDHIAPLAYILKIPLFIEDDKTAEFLNTYYPQIKYFLLKNISMSFLAKNFDGLITCRKWLFQESFAYKNIFKKNMQLIYCPHGNSDKGHICKASFYIYLEQDMTLIYGKHMLDNLKKYKILPKIKHAVIGNYRLFFYQEHKKFYDDLIQKEIFSKLNPKKKTILYAPTWQDLENSTSFFDIFKKIKNNVPKNFNLIIKLHQCLESQNPVQFYQIYEEFKDSNVIILKDFPLIYPLLNRSDIYLGDFSSIGYDFLHFQRPMFFLDPHQRDPANNLSLFLYQCGIPIKKKYWNDIFHFIKNNLDKDFSKVQQKIYSYTFDETINFSKIKKNIVNIF